MHISMMVSDSAALRPILSEYIPSSVPPSGRMKNPTLNVPSDSSSEVSGFGGREIQLRDDGGEHAVQHEVVPFEPVANHRRGNGTRPGDRYRAAADRNPLLHAVSPWPAGN